MFVKINSQIVVQWENLSPKDYSDIKIFAGRETNDVKAVLRDLDVTKSSCTVVTEPTTTTTTTTTEEITTQSTTTIDDGKTSYFTVNS